MMRNWLSWSVVGAALLIGFALGHALFNSTAASSVADMVTAIAAVVALVVGVVTILRQQEAARAQRELEILNRLDREYDAVIFDIYDLHRTLARRPKDANDHVRPEDERYFYRRYFNALENCVRYYRRDVLPKDEFTAWTSSLITRFATEECIVNFDEPKCTPSKIERAWAVYRQRSFGEKKVFTQYLDSIWMATKLDPWKSLIKPVSLDDRQRELLLAASSEIVKAIPVSKQ